MGQTPPSAEIAVVQGRIVLAAPFGQLVVFLPERLSCRACLTVFGRGSTLCGRHVDQRRLCRTGGCVTSAHLPGRLRRRNPETGFGTRDDGSAPAYGGTERRAKRTGNITHCLSFILCIVIATTISEMRINLKR